MKKKRAQAAVELLTTYGWAIMGVILVIGVLSYFDVFDAKRFVSERCDTGSQIQCLEAYAADDGNFSIVLRNNYLVDVTIDKVYVNGISLSQSNGGYPVTLYTPPPTLLVSGNKSYFGVTNIGKLIKGDKKSMDIVITFRRYNAVENWCFNAGTGTGTTCYNVSGSLVVKVQDSKDKILLR